MLNENLINEYSLEEKVVGKWINGKPIYRKTILFDSLPDKTTGRYPHGIDHLGIVVNLKGSMYSKNYTNQTPIPYVVSQENSAAYFGYQIGVDITSQNIIIMTGTQNRKDYIGHIIIEYTKTTD